MQSSDHAISFLVRIKIEVAIFRGFLDQYIFGITIYEDKLAKKNEVFHVVCLNFEQR